MIRSIRHKGLRQFARTGDASKLSVPNAGRVRRVLARLDASVTPADMNLPGFHFHSLSGVERYSVRITGNWRLTFGWDGEDAVDVDLEDYH